MLPRGSWIPAERRGVVSSTGACGLLSLGSSSEMLSQRAGGCQLLEARLTFAILEGAGTISISLGPGLRPRGLLLEDPQILVGAGEVAVTLPSLKILPCWLDAGLELYSTPTHNWGLHHPSPHCTPIPSPARCKTQAPSCQVRGGQTSTGLNSGPSSSLTCCVIPLSSPPHPPPQASFPPLDSDGVSSHFPGWGEFETHDPGASLPGFESELLPQTSHIRVPSLSFLLCNVCVGEGWLPPRWAGEMRLFGIQNALGRAVFEYLTPGTHWYFWCKC